MELPNHPAGLGPAPVQGPRFCARCGHAGMDEPDLCRECGEGLVAQGYCPVCEKHWALEPGSPCPKHDLALSARGPGRGEDRPGAIDQPWVTVGNFLDANRAEAPRIRLEAEGIPTFLEGERMGSPSMYQVATGGVKLQVPESLAADARILLAQSWSPVESEEDDLDDAWDDLAPDAGATWRDLGRAAILFALMAPLLLSLLSLWLNSR